MFQLYLLLRLKNFGRIVIELGIFRIVFLTILTVAAIMILFLAENRFAIPVVCVLLLAGYHNVRKDKEFLRTLTPHLSVFLIKEYTLIALPFAGIEIIKGQFTDAIGLWLFAALLPCLKKIKLKHKPVRLPFLYKGSYEYIRIFRQSFWVYILLFLFATAGTVHGNIKINKVCLILCTGIRLSANNGQQISSSFQKFQDFMPFPTKKHSMECFHHLHSFQLSAYSVYL